MRKEGRKSVRACWFDSSVPRCRKCPGPIYCTDGEVSGTTIQNDGRSGENRLPGDIKLKLEQGKTLKAKKLG